LSQPHRVPAHIVRLGACLGNLAGRLEKVAGRRASWITLNGFAAGWLLLDGLRVAGLAGREQVAARLVLGADDVAAAFPPGLGGIGSGSGEGEEGVDRGLERTGVPLDLGEDEAALERGEESHGEGVRVDVGREALSGLKPSQAVADGG
jgi:hypothetical protein